jgi:acyl-CoA thioester hydrolase
MNTGNDKYKTSIDFEVKTYEIDVAGHVNNIVYVKWLEDLRIKLFSQLLPLENLVNEKLYPVVTSTIINYKRQLKFGDKPCGTMHIDFVKHGLLNLKFSIVNNKNISAYGEQKCVIMNTETGLMNKEKLKYVFDV